MVSLRKHSGTKMTQAVLCTVSCNSLTSFWSLRFSVVEACSAPNLGFRAHTTPQRCFHINGGALCPDPRPVVGGCRVPWLIRRVVRSKTWFRSVLTIFTVIARTHNGYAGHVGNCYEVQLLSNALLNL